MLSKNKLALAVGSLVVLVTTSAFAQDAATNANDVYAWAAAAAGFAIGIAALGGTMSQGRSVSAALEGISRNPGAAPRIQTAMILGLAMIESLVLFALVIAILLWTKITVGA
ncbi:MAG TPA: ATP synthase F0 subunit C [Polyangiaceae bacterium]|jgi:F-type H+-transporting ATPase subunit c|nr:MAG: ATP synthase subunit c [Deltaproteobacteria bacterium ADurb.Bin207]HNS99095.1 ATP synthase F0 subunit C [Polyangiaceae bacterium]HNZ25209.1 ATP synthase F0 subunit C [Polyangiaceae bacterium]HOD25347.1 ATP synthase F0 subunit C [Polyangiaceae bacterium]HOE51574.1 ATP synthase F0 subunit C [Polyangiaceae bacterium]